MSLPFAVTAPIHIARVGLKARDAEALAAFYRDIVGLDEVERRGGVVVLGAGERPLLEIREDHSLDPDDPREAGLFHTAFLLPERTDLARWVKRAMDRRIKIDGASDHLVSEALYLSDPEGNGIEIYVDRPPEQWSWQGDQVAMATKALDLRGLIATLDGADTEWRGAPQDSVIGHVHLRVGDPAQAERWWRDEMGLATMARYGDAAVFLATGGYHHHIGANAWQSAGAGKCDPQRAGLDWVELAKVDATGEGIKTDPWGTEIRIVPAQS